jgi:hypothetical protein
MKMIMNIQIEQFCECDAKALNLSVCDLSPYGCKLTCDGKIVGYIVIRNIPLKTILRNIIKKRYKEIKRDKWSWKAYWEDRSFKVTDFYLNEKYEDRITDILFYVFGKCSPCWLWMDVTKVSLYKYFVTFPIARIQKLKNIELLDNFYLV